MTNLYFCYYLLKYAPFFRFFWKHFGCLTPSSKDSYTCRCTFPSCYPATFFRKCFPGSTVVTCQVVSLLWFVSLALWTGLQTECCYSVETLAAISDPLLIIIISIPNKGREVLSVLIISPVHRRVTWAGFQTPCWNWTETKN